ncbi:flavodoxin-dependent (E)-4-hydroxy-3-methylbut-2-enyl-diphosphate synthase [Desulfoscipio geothermicus]|uniref:4-hydroxy-3-methylbut-2-en-1-yl diphosphate synthase (flavodoxin) n=1 Tax=Desulfoscipio geothermicus DSM 3669 TaxID=1121426 RepID=A0A1I6D8K5_9FIRM|nr:flavodoxin-dependent (E)-4-hydroxy-3-methylbut-2-enyl-diphosphate synthase [Desulfoscipio geothermicus]SFR01687.1 4-hydroxy-3-methylbut-2-en-1-yl diphosphate synthase [Desulfoscipio geothermicus DSM 3669]
MQRRKSRPVRLGSVTVGGGAPVSVQSMTNTDTRDVAATRAQIKRLVKAGCEIVRVAVPDWEAARALPEIKKGLSVPLVADVHFNYRLALAAIEAGVDGLRINPGNIGGRDKVAAVVEAAAQKRVPIRIGVNAGSLEKDLLRDGITPEAMVESALRHVAMLEEMGFFDIKISLKASDVPLMAAAYRMLADKVDYPLHIGVTEAGTAFAGSVKSAVGIGILLWEGIGDTVRVSLTGDPVQEVRVAYEILKTLGLRRRGAELISCPTCGRTQIDLIKIAGEVEERLAELDRPLKVAVMGCVVNGPGEARHADVGIAGGKGEGLIFRKGQVIRKVPENLLVEELMKEIDNLVNGGN